MLNLDIQMCKFYYNLDSYRMDFDSTILLSSSKKDLENLVFNIISLENDFKIENIKNQLKNQTELNFTFEGGFNLSYQAQKYSYFYQNYILSQGINLFNSQDNYYEFEFMSSENINNQKDFEKYLNYIRDIHFNLFDIDIKKEAKRSLKLVNEELLNSNIVREIIFQI